MGMSRSRKKANEAIRASARRSPVEREERPETPEGLPATLEDVLALPVEDLETTAAELEMRATDLAREHALVSSLAGAASIRIAQEGGGEDA